MFLLVGPASRDRRHIDYVSFSVPSVGPAVGSPTIRTRARWQGFEQWVSGPHSHAYSARTTGNRIAMIRQGAYAAQTEQVGVGPEAPSQSGSAEPSTV